MTVRQRTRHPAMVTIGVLAAGLGSTAPAAAAGPALFAATQQNHTIVVGNLNGTGVGLVGHGDEAFWSPSGRYLSISDDLPSQRKPLRLVTMQGAHAVRTRTLPCTLPGPWAPDERHFVCTKDPPPGGFTRWFLVDAVTGRTAPLVSKMSQCNIWLPTSRAVFCYSSTSGVLERFSVPSRKGRIVMRGVDFVAAQSPNRKLAAVVTKTPNDSTLLNHRKGLKLLNLATLRTRKIPVTGFVNNASFSPDSKKLAITAGSTNFPDGLEGIGTRLTIRTLSSGAVRKGPNVNTADPIWMTNRRLVVSLHSRIGRFTIRNVGTISSSGTGLRRLTHDTNGNGNIGFFPAGWTSDLKQFGLRRTGLELTTPEVFDDLAWTVSSNGTGLHVLGQGGLRMVVVLGNAAYATTDPRGNDDDPAVSDFVRVGFAPNAKPTVILRHAVAIRIRPFAVPSG